MFAVPAPKRLPPNAVMKHQPHPGPSLSPRVLAYGMASTVQLRQYPLYLKLGHFSDTRYAVRQHIRQHIRQHHANQPQYSR